MLADIYGADLRICVHKVHRCPCIVVLGLGYLIFYPVMLLEQLSLLVLASA